MNGRSHQTILDGIARLRTRWWRVNVLRYALQALFYLLLVSALVLLVFPSLDTGTLSLTLLGFAVLAGAGTAMLRRPSEAALAKDFDDVAGLKDRVSSTVELMGKSDGPMVDALTEEAAQVTRDVPSTEVYPYAMPREGWWLPVPALLVAAVLWLPGFFSEPALADTVFDQSLEERIEELEDMLSTERQRELTPRQKELMEELEKLKSELSGDKVDRKDTMAEVAKLLEELEQQRDAEKQKELELKKLLKSLQEDTGNKDLEEQLQNGDYQQALNKLREQLDELKKKLEEMKKDGASPEELKQLEELIKEMEEIEAKLMQLLQIDLDLDMMGKAIHFLADWDGELGDLEDLVPASMVEPGEP